MDRRSEYGGLTTHLMSCAPSDNVPVADAFRRAGYKGKAALILATWFGTGLMPRASGTFGTLAAIPLVLIGCLGVGWSVAALVGITVIAIWSSHRTQELLGKEDPSEVVIDEVAGFLVTLFLLPPSWMNIALGFFLFRFFDVLKPWPVRQAERLNGGFGIVTDDLLAGVYAHLFLRGTWLFAG